MQILVTGGVGFIGSSIVDRLIEMGYSTVMVDDLSSGKCENINPEAKFYQVDISNPELENVFVENQISHVIHLAAQIDVQKSIEDPVKDARSNILGTVNLLEYCKKYKVRKLVYASSAAVYGEPEYLPIDVENPINSKAPYGISKYTSEIYIQAYNHLYNLDYTILRYANVYGPGQDHKSEGGVISIFVDRMLRGKNPVIFGDGKQSRDFVYVDDVVDATIIALDKGNNKTVNISCNTANTVNDIYIMINKILNTDIEASYKEERKGDIRHSYLDNKEAIKALGWEPKYNLFDGLRETIDYYTGVKEAAVSSE